MVDRSRHSHVQQIREKAHTAARGGTNSVRRGGQRIPVHVDAQLTITYMMNRMLGGTVGDERGAKLVFAAYAAAVANSPAS